MPRFTVLRHQTGPAFARTADSGQSVHWDWLFEWDSSFQTPIRRDTAETSRTLRTWATPPLSEAPSLSDWLAQTPPSQSQRISAVELPWHRSIYLDFEGDIGGERGRVDQVMTGTFQMLSESDEMISLELTRLRPSVSKKFLLQLRRQSECQEWTLELARIETEEPA